MKLLLEKWNKFLIEARKLPCPAPTQDLELNTKNRDAAIQAEHIQYGPLNVGEPGDYWRNIAEYWDTTEEAAQKSLCGNCVAFDISPRMKDCMPGETSDEDGDLGYCWMHHFKCHSARSCRTWAKGGPILEDDISEDWQSRHEDKEELEEGGKPGLWANIAAKKKRMKAGSGEKKAKPGEADYPKTLDIKETFYEVDAIDDNEEYCPVCREAQEIEEEKKPCKPSKGKRFAKRVDGKCRSYGQSGKAKDGGDRIRPGTAKADAYCARSAGIKKCKNPPCANTLSRKKWKCQGKRSVVQENNCATSYWCMVTLQKLVFTLFALLIITSCVSSQWSPTTIYHPETENIQTTTPIAGEYIVMIYSTDWCYWCKVAKKWMKKEKIKFLERDYDDPFHKKKLKEYAKTIGYKGDLNSVPIFVIGKKILIGYNPDQILCEIGRSKCSSQLFSSWQTPLEQD